MLHHLFISQVGAGLHSRCGCLTFPLHKGVQGSRQTFIVALHSTCTVHISCDRHKAVGDAGKVDFQTVLAVIDIINRLIIGKVRGQLEEATQTRAGGRTFEIAVREETQDRCRHIIEGSVLTDAVVDVDGTDALADTVADTIPAAHGIGLHGSREIREGGCIIGFGHRAVARIIRHLGHSATALLFLPQAERCILLQLGGDVNKIYAHKESSFLINIFSMVIVNGTLYCSPSCAKIVWLILASRSVSST